jgi:cysteinyl-tRNA synthetase
MKKFISKINLLFILLICFFIISCPSQSSSSGGGNGDDDDYNSNTIYKEYMRTFVRDISVWAKLQETGFIIIPQNGHELATVDGDNNGSPHTAYIAAIDGAGQEDLFFGYNNDDEATPTVERNYLLDFLNIYEANGVEVLVTDYCSTPGNVTDSYTQSALRSFISFAADRPLDNIPGNPPFNENGLSVNLLSDAQNFLYVLDTSNIANFINKSDFVNKIDATNYDVIIIDLYYYDNSGNEIQLDAADITALKTKPGGNSRLVICYMSIGEAEDYRYYWDDGNGDVIPPSFLKGMNPDWPGNYKVEYWDPAWQSIIFGNGTSYLQKIIDVGFDGVYLDIIDAFEYFE